MKIKREELISVLEIVKPGLAANEMLEQATSFIFSENHVMTYNDEICIKHPFTFIGSDCAVRSDEMYGLLSKLHVDEIEVEFKEDEIQIKAGKVDAGLKIETEIHVPIKDEINESIDWRELSDPKSFVRHVKMAAMTCSDDMSKPKLACIDIKNDGSIHGSDGFRFIQCNGPELPVNDFLFYAKSALEVVKIEPTEIALDEGWIHFRNDDGTTISCRRMSIEYVEQEVIDKVLKFKGDVTIKFPNTIDEMLERSRHFAKRDFVFEESVLVVIEKGKLKMRAEADKTKSWIEERAPIKTDKTISFSVTPMLFSDILSSTTTCRLDESVTKVKFAADDWEYVIMLRGDGNMPKNPRTRTHKKK